ncbi:AMP-binding protein [Streptomyces thioluteus]
MDRENTMQDAPEFLHSGFHAAARRHPDRPALELGGRTWTYAELDETVRRWAAALLAVADRPRRIGVLGHRSLVTYAGFLAGLYTGAAVVPLNRKYPVARNRDIAERSELDVVLADDRSVPQLPDLLDGLEHVPAVVLPETAEVPADLPSRARVLTRADVAGTTPLTGPVLPDPDDTAYIIFTSGSTGRPKGVPVAHANIAHFLRVNSERYRVRPEDRFANTADQTFDLAVFEVFMPWGAGACLVPPDPAQLLSPLDFIREKRITVWFSVPSAAVLQHRRGLFAPGSLPSLRLSLFGGEALPASTAAAWQEAAPGSVVDNLYGPTEAAVACLVHRWDPGHLARAGGQRGRPPSARPTPA